MNAPTLTIQTQRETLPLLKVKDVWGKVFYVNADRWNAGRTFLTAYKKDGIEWWKPGKHGLSAHIYHRENIAKVMP